MKNHYSNYNKELEAFQIEFLQNYLFGKILEVGCGIGRILKHFTKFNIFGLDLVFENLREAKEIIPDGIFICSDVKHLSTLLKPKSFDCVFSCEHLQHISDREYYKEIQAMKKLARKHVILIESGPRKFEMKYFISRDYREIVSVIKDYKEFSNGRYSYQAVLFEP